jgi:hypothetical protein
MIDRAQASKKAVPRDLGALGALPRAAKRRMVDLREPGAIAEAPTAAGGLPEPLSSAPDDDIADLRRAITRLTLFSFAVGSGATRSARGSCAAEHHDRSSLRLRSCCSSDRSFGQVSTAVDHTADLPSERQLLRKHLRLLDASAPFSSIPGASSMTLAHTNGWCLLTDDGLLRTTAAQAHVDAWIPVGHRANGHAPSLWY